MTRQGAKGTAVLLILLMATIGPAMGNDGAPKCYDSEPDPIVDEHHQIESHDGVELALTLWYNSTRTDEPRPVILGGHGWAGQRADLEERARWLVDEGYVVLAWDSRGFGESGGAVGLNGPDDWADVAAIIDWLSEDDHCPAVLFDAADDPRLGMIGGSYGGAIQLLAAAHDDRIDAIVPDIAWNDLVHSLAPETLVKRGWVDLLYWAGQASSHGLSYTPPNPNTGGMDERLTGWYLEATLTGRLPEDAIDALTLRSPATHMESITAHTLITQGYNDTLFLPDEALANYEALAGRENAETHLIFHPAGHGHGLNDATRDTYRSLVLQFYDRHLKGDALAPLPSVIYWDPQPGAFHAAGSWPPAGTVEDTHPLSSSQGGDTVTLAQLPAPTSHTEWQQFSGDYNEQLGPWLPEHFDATDLSRVLLDAGLDDEQPVTILGRPRLSLAVTPHVEEATLFISLVDTSGNTTVVYNQVTPVRIEGKNGERVDLEIPLSSLAYTIGAGDTLQVRVTTSDLAFHGAREAGSIDVHVDATTLTLPQPA